MALKAFDRVFWGVCFRTLTYLELFYWDCEKGSGYGKDLSKLGWTLWPTYENTKKVSVRNSKLIKKKSQELAKLRSISTPDLRKPSGRNVVFFLFSSPALHPLLYTINKLSFKLNSTISWQSSSSSYCSCIPFVSYTVARWLFSMNADHPSVILHHRASASLR